MLFQVSLFGIVPLHLRLNTSRCQSSQPSFPPLPYLLKVFSQPSFPPLPYLLKATSAPEGSVSGKPDDEDDEDTPIYTTTLDKQRQVYMHNILPHWALKNFFSVDMDGI